MYKSNYWALNGDNLTKNRSTFPAITVMAPTIECYAGTIKVYLIFVMT